jgi:hypothetical protein
MSTNYKCARAPAAPAKIALLGAELAAESGAHAELLGGRFVLGPSIRRETVTVAW